MTKRFLRKGEKMNLKTIRLEFGPSEIQKILSIALDDDKEGALEFIKGSLAKQIEKELTSH